MNRGIASNKLGAKLFSLVAHHLDGASLRWTNGRFAPGAFLTGVPLVTLTAVGAKSGQPRSLPLLATPDGDNIILIASNWGGKKHPSWYYNVKANPEVQIGRHGQTLRYMAQEVTGTERERCWQQAVAIYPGYELYKSRTNGREIPIFLLTPSL
jgi:deazaflavin-dependent oxidoreductase (nitroreductase family)